MSSILWPLKARAGLPISETMAQLKRRRRETGLGVGLPVFEMKGANSSSLSALISSTFVKPSVFAL